MEKFKILEKCLTYSKYMIIYLVQEIHFKINK